MELFASAMPNWLHFQTQLPEKTIKYSQNLELANIFRSGRFQRNYREKHSNPKVFGNKVQTPC